MPVTVPMLRVSSPAARLSFFDCGRGWIVETGALRSQGVPVVAVAPIDNNGLRAEEESSSLSRNCKRKIKVSFCNYLQLK